MAKKKLKVLVSAYACSPNRGSEPGVGWGFITALAEKHDLWVLVEKSEFEESILEFLRKNPNKLTSVHFIFIQRIRHLNFEKLYPPSYYWTYRKWHFDAYRAATELHKSVDFDLAHQLTMVGFREPGYLWRMGIPFVWGPVGGMGVFSWRFLLTVGTYGALYYLGYNLFNLFQMRFARRPRLAARAAGAGLLAATPENQVGAAHYWNCPSTLLSEVGLPPKNNAVKPAPRQGSEPLRIVWTGLHIPRKALNLGLEAVGAVPELMWELHILGEGPRTEDWKAQAEQLGIAGRCRFHGWLARDTALDIMASAHVMLITSLRDLTSTVTIEALAMGLPIVCLDHCGFAGVVDESCGVKVPVTRPSETIAGLASALRQLAVDDELRCHLAQGALRRAQDFSWDKKAVVVERLYRQVLDESGKS